jgi:hypothetical protein
MIKGQQIGGITNRRDKSKGRAIMTRGDYIDKTKAKLIN